MSNDATPYYQQYSYPDLHDDWYPQYEAEYEIITDEDDENTKDCA